MDSDGPGDGIRGDGRSRGGETPVGSAESPMADGPRTPRSDLRAAVELHRRGRRKYLCTRPERDAANAAQGLQ